MSGLAKWYEVAQYIYLLHAHNIFVAHNSLYGNIPCRYMALIINARNGVGISLSTCTCRLLL